jgi:hypothetical protein
VRWINDVATVEYGDRLNDKVDFLDITISLFDRYLAKKHPPVEKMQAYGTACMWIATKFVDDEADQFTPYLYAEDYVSAKEAVAAERDVLCALRWEILQGTSIAARIE